MAGIWKLWLRERESLFFRTGLLVSEKEIDYIQINGSYTSTCSRYLLKEERTCDGLFFLSKYRCISSACLCRPIPTTRIYSHLPASVNKRLKRKHDKKTDPEILQQPSVRIRKQCLVARQRRLSSVRPLTSDPLWQKHRQTITASDPEAARYPVYCP